MMERADEIGRVKALLRQTVAEALARLEPNERRASGIAVAERVKNLPAVRAARTLMTYLPLPSEIDTWPLIRWAWRAGKRVAVPRIEPPPAGADVPFRERSMVAMLLPTADVESVAAHPQVRPGPLGILEVADGPPIPVGEIDVMLMPCQAVDRAGHRLGKGGGFFDRFLASSELRAVRIVLAFHGQVLDEVPVEPHDQPVEMVVTDAEILTFTDGSADRPRQKRLRPTRPAGD